jgi:hypothetical protein
MFAWILNTKPAKLGSSGATGPAVVSRARRARGELDELAQERLDAEVGERRAEERRAERAGHERVAVERAEPHVEQLEVLAQLVERVRRAVGEDLGRVEPALVRLQPLRAARLAALEQVDVRA